MREVVTGVLFSGARLCVGGSSARVRLADHQAKTSPRESLVRPSRKGITCSRIALDVTIPDAQHTGASPHDYDKERRGKLVEQAGTGGGDRG